MEQFLEYVKIAYKSIISNKARTVLTMLGIIIGIASVIMISGLGSGVKNTISGSLGDLFGGQTYIYAEGDVYITKDDVLYIKENVPNLKMCTMDNFVYADTESIKGGFTAYTAFVNETYEYYETEGRGMKYGRYFTEDECNRNERVCVVNEKGAEAFFGSSDVVGKDITIDVYGTEITYRIVGVRNASEAALQNLLDGEVTQINLEVPYGTYEQASGEDFLSNDFYDILVSTSDGNTAVQTIERIVRILEARHDVRGEDMFYIDSFDTYMKTVNQVIGYITLFVAFVSLISLFVGGIGVMNIMLVSVTERTQEIGIRKALGARTSSIMTQFLAEASMITFVGGIIGVLLGYGGAECLCLIAGAIVKIPVHISVNPFIVIGAGAFSAAIGLGFGIFPARKAAKLNPIDALRQE